MKKRIHITAVGVMDGVALFKGTVIDSLIESIHHEVQVKLEVNDELTLEKIAEEFTKLEIERENHPDQKLREDLAEKFLGKDFEIEIPEEESA